ncbi:hypothetical protein PFISCL1PPCAC_10608, partial [Pristionchus fissidentatus]
RHLGRGMAVPGGIPVEQSISEIDAEIRMEDIRQSPAARLKMEHFYSSIKKNLMDKKLNYEAEHRKEILEGLKRMKRHLPADSGATLVKKLENLSLNLECLYQNENDMFMMKNDDLILTVHHKQEKALYSRVSYFGEQLPTDDEITRRINEDAWEELRVLIHLMLRTVPSSAPREIRQKLARYRLDLEQSLMSQWKGGETASISELNTSPVGFPSRATTVRPQRLFIYGEPGIEIELRENGLGVIDVEKGDVPFAELLIVDYDKDNLFSFRGTSLSYRGVVKLQLSSRWMISAQTVDQLSALGARVCSILQRTSLIRLIANCTMKESDLELMGHELGRNVRYLVKEEWIGEERDAIVDSFYVEKPENLEMILSLLHRQAVFNSSWESIAASCCQKYSSSRSVRFEMIPRGCEWEIIFCGQECLYNLRLSSLNGRHWSVNLFSSHNSKLSDVSSEIENAFNRTWSLSKCLSHLITRLGIVGLECTVDESMDTSLPLLDCSLSYASKVGQAWLRKEVIPPPPPPKHELRVDLPKGRCPLLRMMREKATRKPFKVARPRPQLSNPTIPPLRVNRVDVGLPPLQSHSNITPYTHIDKTMKSAEEGNRSLCPPPSMGSIDPSVYPHSGYSPIPTHRMQTTVPSGTSPLVRSTIPPQITPYQPDMIRQQQQHQQLMRQQSTASLSNSGIFDFPDESGSSPSSVQDLSPGYSYGYANTSPLVRGATTKSRRARGRKAGNVGDRTPASSIDSPSYSPFSPEGPKRPKSGPGSRGGRGSRGKRGITMDQVVSPFQRSLSEMSNTMSSPLASATPAYSQHSFDDGTSDDECDPPPFSRVSQPSTFTPPIVVPSPLSTTSVFPPQTAPITPPVSTLPPSHHSTPIISVVPSPLVPSSSSIPTLASVLSTPPILPPVSSTTPSSSLSSFSSIPSTSTSTPSTFVPSLVRRKSSLESIVGQLNASHTKKTAVHDLFDTGLESSPPSSPLLSVHSNVSAAAPILIPETKTESPRKDGEEKIVLKLKTKSTKDGKKKEKEKEKDKEKKRDDKSTKIGEEKEKDRKRKAESSSKDKKDKEAKKAKTAEQPLIGGESFVTKMGMLKGFKIPKTGPKGGSSSDLSIPSSSSSLAAPLVSPSLTKPSASLSSSQGKGVPSGSQPPFRPPSTQMKAAPSARQSGPKSILKAGPPGPPAPRQHFPERKISHPPFHEPPRSRHSSGGGAYPPPPSSSHTPSMPQMRRGGAPTVPKGGATSSSWVPLQPRMEGPPTLTPAISGPAHSSRHDQPPTLEIAKSIIDDSPASPDGLQIVDD